MKLNSFGSGVFHTDSMLEQENCTIEQLLKCNDFENQYRIGNPKLLEYFSKKDNVKSIYTFIMNQNSRKEISKAFNILKNSNTFLLRELIDSIPLFEYVLESITNQKNSNYQYAFGIFSQLIFRSFITWPKEVPELFKYSNKAYYILIDNLDQDCVYVFINNLLSQSYPISEFVWHIFRAISDSNLHPPRSCFLTDNVNVPNISKKKNHKLNALSIIHKFFNLNLSNVDDFRQIFLNYICEEVVKNDDFPILTEIASDIGQSDRLEQIAIERIQNSIEASQFKGNNLNTFILANWLDYLSICLKNGNENRMINDEIVIHFTETFLTENMFDLCLQKLTRLIDEYIKYKAEEENESFRSFIDKLKFILLNSWQLFQDKNPFISPFVLKIASLAFNKSRVPFAEEIRSEIPKAFLETLQNWEREDFINIVDDGKKEKVRLPFS